MLYLVILIIILGLNVLTGAMFPAYEWFNVGFSSGVVVANYLLIYLLYETAVKDGFRVSLTFIFPLLALTEFVLAIISPAEFSNNGYLLGVISLFMLQLLIYLIVYIVSKK